jgi:hypothetical protein
MFAGDLDLPRQRIGSPDIPGGTRGARRIGDAIQPRSAPVTLRFMLNTRFPQIVLVF